MLGKPSDDRWSGIRLIGEGMIGQIAMGFSGRNKVTGGDCYHAISRLATPC